jgi:hypothetical protein
MLPPEEQSLSTEKNSRIDFWLSAEARFLSRTCVAAMLDGWDRAPHGTRLEFDNQCQSGAGTHGTQRRRMLRVEGPNPEEAGAGADTKAGCREETDKGAWPSCILRTKKPLASQNHGQSTQSPLRARRRGLKGASRTTADLSKSSAPGRVASRSAPRNKQTITYLCKIYDIVAQRSPRHKTRLHIDVASRPQIEKDLYCAWLD